jgi:hypothetical protein
VFGGTYFLTRGIQSIETGAVDGEEESKRVNAVTTDGARIECRNLVVESRYVPDVIAARSKKRSTSRAVLLTDRFVTIRKTSCMFFESWKLQDGFFLPLWSVF